VASYSVERWNYRRSASYGSPHFRLDGSKGQETLMVASAHLSKDLRSVFLVLPDMQSVMQMRLGWSLKAGASTSMGRQAFASSAYFSPEELRDFNSRAEGFDSTTIDLTRRPARAGSLGAATADGGAVPPPTSAEGRRVAELMGCVACHSDDGSTLGKVGPTWRGLFGSSRELIGGGSRVADEAYLRESILDPPAKVPRGFENGDIGMPSYEGILTDVQVEALVLYLKSLR
jgi:mono/diheme cytochrome c family protein